jgi:hypothetical protein
MVKMYYGAYKFVRTGNGFKERLHIKTFKTMDKYCDFLAKKYDEGWKSITHDKEYDYFKTGIYAYCGGKWHNVKTLDVSVLAHV